MKKRLFLFILTAFLSLCFSCKKNPDNLTYTIIKNEANLTDLWLFTLENHLIGVNPQTLERELDVKFNYTVSSPTIINDKLYLGEMSRGNGNFGNHVLCLNKNLKLKEEIPVLPNIWNLYKADNYMIADSWCYYDDMNAGFSVIDLNTNKTVLTYDTLSEVMCNKGQNCSYNDRLYIGSFQQSVNNKPFSVSIFDAKTLQPVEENSSRFCSKDDEYADWAYTNILINNNQLWIVYFYYHLICVYDLDTNERIARINLKTDYNIPELINEPEAIILDDNNQVTEESTPHYVLRLPQFINGKFHILLREEYQDYGPTLNDILIINPATFALEKEIRLNKDLPGASEIKYSPVNSDSILVRSFNVIDEFSMEAGELINSVIVLNKN